MNVSLSPPRAIRSSAGSAADRLQSLRTLVADAGLQRLLAGPEGFRLFRSLDNEMNLHFGEREFAASFASAGAGEGRASVALLYGLLSAVYSSDLRVVYVDAGSEAATLGERLHLDRTLETVPGLHDVLSGAAAPDDCVQTTALPNLAVVSGGSASGSPSVFSTSRFKALVAAATARADRVIFDLPPLETHREALAMVRAVPDCVLVVRARSTSRTRVDLALRDLEAVDARLVGTILSNHRSPFGRRGA